MSKSLLVRKKRMSKSLVRKKRIPRENGKSKRFLNKIFNLEFHIEEKHPSKVKAK